MCRPPGEAPTLAPSGYRNANKHALTQTPLLYRDLYEFRHPGTPAVLNNWDNGDWARFGPPGDARVDSFESCGKACEASRDCVQWLWRGLDAAECVLMRQVRYGVPREPEPIPQPEPKEGEEAPKEPRAPKPKEKWVNFKSGWMTQRIDRWREQRTCSAVQWVGPSITRVY